MFGSGSNGMEKPAAMELVRLALPRRMYTMGHIDYAVDIIRKVVARAHTIRRMRIVRQPKRLRHFTAAYEYEEADEEPMTM